MIEYLPRYRPSLCPLYSILLIVRTTASSYHEKRVFRRIQKPANFLSPFLVIPFSFITLYNGIHFLPVSGSV